MTRIVFVFFVFLFQSGVLSAEKNASMEMSIFAEDSAQKSAEMQGLQKRLDEIEDKEEAGNVWTKIYSNYQTYQRLKDKEEKFYKENYRLKRIKKRTKEQEEQYKENGIELQTIKGKLELLKEFEEDPFKRLISPPIIDNIPEIGNPVGILGAVSYKKKLTDQQKNYEATYESLKDEIKLLKEKNIVLMKLLEHSPESMDLIAKVQYVQKELDTFKPVFEIFKTTKEVHNKKLEETRLKLNSDIQQEYQKMFKIAGVIVVFFLFFLLTKFIVRRYMSNKDSYYMVNKAANFLFLTIIILVLLFAYIENVSYMVTILGFASAGIAIAMKDWFMSLMGWWVIVIGGSIHVGDRVKFVKDGVEYVGDIVDISLLRMTMQEDVTLTTFMYNRRSGRIIFIPNNYIFTDMIANYSHAGLKTVWDGIDFTVTFDSNIEKAVSIAKEVTKKYSKGYTDITRKQLNKLRSHYHIKNTNVEPRIFSFIEPHGVIVSAWYLTNAYATLTLRSKISMEIIQRIQERDDIEIAYPTQSLHMSRNIPKPDLSIVDSSSKETDES
ncbi:MAG: mechanosensitive ion channel [Sulfurovum sp.]|nr:mechanosensitive ion channel [Sulfurovum sp.]